MVGRIHVLPISENNVQNTKQLVVRVDHIKIAIVTLICVIVLLNGYEWSFNSVTITPERLAVMPLFLVILLYFLMRGRVGSLPNTNIILIAWLLIALFSSLLSPVSSWSLKMYVSLLVSVAYYYYIILLRADPIAIIKSRGFLLLALFFGPVVSTVYFMSINDFPVHAYASAWLQEGGGGTRIRATIYEANLFGAILSFVTFGVLAIKYQKKFWWWLLLLGLHLSLILSFSRLPWIAYFFGLGVYFVLIYPRRYDVKIIAKYIVYLVIILFFMVGILYTVFSLYGDHELVSRTHSIKTRFIMWSLAIDSFYSSPIFGRGIFSFSELYPHGPSLVGSDTYRSVWISNLPLAILHDTGILGMVLFWGFVIIMIGRSWKLVRYMSVNFAIEPINVRIGAALVASSTSIIIIASQSIPSHSLAFFWVLIALTERYAIKYRKFTGAVRNAHQSA